MTHGVEVTGAPRLSLDALRKDYLLWALLAVLALLTAYTPARIADYADLVDWRTIAALTGMLVLTTGIELSGYLHRLGRRLLDHLSSERAIAVFMVAAAALLSMVITNDVALFILVPLTVSLRAISRLPVVRLVTFEALAVNAGSALTPIGNPQNLFLWQSSGVAFHQYVVAMAPLALCMLAPLFVLTLFAFQRRDAAIRQHAPLPETRKPLLWLSLGLYLPFLRMVELQHTIVATLAVLAIFLIRHRRVLLHVDWLLILTFVLMFVDLRLLAALPAVSAGLEQLQLSSSPYWLYFTGVGASQILSNVPAAILLAQYSQDWRVIAYGVNVGGFGILLGSLANLIALRLVRDRRFWVVFHAYSLPFLAVTCTLVYFAMRWSGG